LLEDAAAAGVAGDARGARVELEAAAFGCDGDAERIAREQQLRHAAFRDRRPSGAAGFAGTVNLQDALARGEPAGGSDLLDQRLDIRAQELERSIAALADQVEVPRVPVGVLEAETALAEVDLPRDAGVHHPLQGAVDGGAADSLVLAPD